GRSRRVLGGLCRALRKAVDGARYPLVLAPPDLAQPPATAQIFLDDKLVATALPASVTLEEGASHQLRVEAAGFAVFQLPLPPGSHNLQLLKLPLVAAEAVVNEGDAPKQGDAPSAAVPSDTVAGEVAAVVPELPSTTTSPDKVEPAEKTEPPPGVEASAPVAVQEAAVTPEDAEAPLVSAAGVQVADAGPWRVSFTTITDGASLAGARVYRDGAVVGTTPFEAEIASDVTSVRFEVQADGYAVRQLDIERRGRDHVGPSSLRLLKPAEEEDKAAASSIPEPVPAREQALPSSRAGTKSAEASPVAMPPELPIPAVSTSGAQAPVAPAEARTADPPSAAEGGESTQRRQRAVRPRQVSLALGTRPIAQVIVDGSKIPQTTPLMGARALKLRPGEHTIQFVDTKTNNRYRYKVTLPADSPSNKLIIILGGDIRVKEGTVKAVELK
ncbi:MAG: hypothetical protein ACO3JL_18095, partial [Myxococcota bacterium]